MKQNNKPNSKERAREVENQLDYRPGREGLAETQAAAVRHNREVIEKALDAVAEEVREYERERCSIIYSTNPKYKNLTDKQLHELVKANLKRK